MQTLTQNYSTYAKAVNCNRELVIVEGRSARFDMKSFMDKNLIRSLGSIHRRIANNNINKYGKIKR